MLDSFILSKNFDRNFFFLRKYIPYINRRYNYLHNINFKEQRKHSHPNLDEMIAEAEEALQVIKSASAIRNTSPEIPKKIWLYWNSPVEEAPDVVQNSLLSWRK